MCTACALLCERLSQCDSALSEFTALAIPLSLHFVSCKFILCKFTKMGHILVSNEGFWQR